MPYSAYVLSHSSRKQILQTFSPKYSEVIAHHITHCFPDDHPPPEISIAQVVGYASDHRVECLVIELDGNCERPSGGIYHITLSIDREQGAKPVHSNDVIQTGWTHLETPLIIDVSPQSLGHYTRKKKKTKQEIPQQEVSQQEVSQQEVSQSPMNELSDMSSLAPTQAIKKRASKKSASKKNTSKKTSK